MTNITDCMKCPNCHRKGHFEIILRKKNAYAECQACDELITDRIPYPKHRTDHEGYQYQFEIPSVRPVTSQPEDNETCSQEEWDDRHS